MVSYYILELGKITIYLLETCMNSKLVIQKLSSFEVYELAEMAYYAGAIALYGSVRA